MNCFVHSARLGSVAGGEPGIASESFTCAPERNIPSQPTLVGCLCRKRKRSISFAADRPFLMAIVCAVVLFVSWSLRDIVQFGRSAHWPSEEDRS